ncbi:MAG TPA: menaquinone biosynthesis decarboxylase, partial [Chthoniobacteraceae bacterium]|nr:menaquinone biosynthesis decarboxylase [Chthoniobacteraceae bacterium]
MAHPSFLAFVEALENAGELKRIGIPAATELEISEWANREMKSPGGGAALLFESPTVNGARSPFPLAINTMGSRRRMALALGISDVADLAHEMQLLLKSRPPTDFQSAWK